jgi:hypothetical protein
MQWGGKQLSGRKADVLGSRPTLVCEQVLSRLTFTVEGQELDLVRLLGAEVPSGVELFFCLQTFVQVKIEIKCLNNDETHVHEYNDAAGKNGIYELKCKQSSHHLVAKVQPALGLRALVPALLPSRQAALTENDLEDLLERKLYALLGMYEMLVAFLRDSSRERVSLDAGFAPHASQLAADPDMLRVYVERSQVARRCDESSVPTVVLSDAAKPKTRGMLLKAFFEVKVLLVEAVIFLEDRKLPERLRGKLADLVSHLKVECCTAGIHQQYEPKHVALSHLSMLVCGPVNSAARDDAWPALEESCTYVKKLYERLVQKGDGLGLNPPTMELLDKLDVVAFKNDYTMVCQRAVEGYLRQQIQQQFGKLGLEAGKKTLRKMWNKPDHALSVICPNGKRALLSKATQKWEKELDRIVKDVTGSKAVNSNPRNMTGLENPGDNLCATNSMLQILFSSERFREAILNVPGFKENAPPGLDSTGPEAKLLVEELYKLFAEMSDPCKFSTKARGIAVVLYENELGLQQDADELLHRASSILDDGSKLPGDPYCTLRQTFRRLFMGATYGMLVRTKVESSSDAAVANGSGSQNSHFEQMITTTTGEHVIGYPLLEDASQKCFLSILVHSGNQNLTDALEDFTSWSCTGGSDVVATREQFRTLPPLLIFSIKEMRAMHWEDSLDLTRFTFEAPPARQRDLYERARLRHMRSELCERMEVASQVNTEAAETRSQVQKQIDSIDQQLDELQRGVSDGGGGNGVVEAGHHIYDAHAVIMYHGKGHAGHYISFIRDVDGTFLCFDDEYVSEVADTAQVREQITSRGSANYPASVRTLVYRRRGAEAGEPLELTGGARALSRQTPAPETGSESSPKRSKTE